MQQFFYLVSAGLQGMEVRRLQSIEQVQPLLGRLANGQNPDLPCIHEYPQRVQEALDSLEKGVNGWLLIPAQESDGPSLSHHDREFLEALGQSTLSETPSPTLFEQIVSKVQEFVPRDKRQDQEVERLAILSITDILARSTLMNAFDSGLETHEQGRATPQLLDQSEPTPRVAQLYFHFKVGEDLTARFSGEWTKTEEWMEETLGMEYGEFVDVGWQFLSGTDSSISEVPVPAKNEVWLSVDSLLRVGLKFDLTDLDLLSLRAALKSLIVSRLPHHFNPDHAVEPIRLAEEYYPQTLRHLRECQWYDGRLYSLFKTLLHRGLPLSAVYLRELFTRLDEIDPIVATGELGLLAEKSLFAWNCMYAYTGTSLRAVKLSKESQSLLRDVRGCQQLLSLSELRTRRERFGEALVVPHNLCMTARLLFGRVNLVSDLAVPEELELVVVGEI